MNRIIFAMLPFVLLSCSSGPERIKADLKDLQHDAERNDAKAQWELGSRYMKLGNWTEANKWLLEAARRGITDAQYQLAQNYEKGQGLRKDFVEAYAWFALAAQRGHLMAINARERLSRLLSHADLAEANRLAYSYATTTPDEKGHTPGDKNADVR